MRKYTHIKTEIKIELSGEFNLKKVMLYETEGDGVFLFLYNTAKDTCGCADLWFENLQAAEALCQEEYGVNNEDWVLIDDPLPFCQQDFIAPVRVRHRADGQPEWGSFEILTDKGWKDYSPF